MNCFYKISSWKLMFPIFHKGEANFYSIKQSLHRESQTTFSTALHCPRDQIQACATLPRQHGKPCLCFFFPGTLVMADTLDHGLSSSVPYLLTPRFWPCDSSLPRSIPLPPTRVTRVLDHTISHLQISAFMSFSPEALWDSVLRFRFNALP